MATILHHPGQEALEDQPGIEERRALIERVAASEQFARAARLRDFLLYVGKHSLKAGSPEIHEQEIGAKVFGRPESYDTSQDNIVRVNATELRKRIELYFATEGAYEPLILEIPRGGYKPIFHRRLPEAEGHRTSALEELLHSTSLHHDSDSIDQSSPRLLSHILWATVCLLLAITCAVLFVQNRSMHKTLHPWEDKPAVAAFWGDFLRNNQQTDIVLPDDSASVIENITRHRITLGDYLSRSFLQQIQSSDFSADRKEDLNELFNHNLITFGGVLAAQRIIALDPFSLSLHLTASRFYEADSLKRDNAILIGGKKANPWVFLFDDQLNFNLDTAGAGMFVINNHPQPGEQAVYTESSTQKGPVGYSVVAYLPNPSRTGNTIIVAGTDSDASSAAAEFITSEEQLQKFRNIIHADHFPYFEVLLKTSEVRGTSFNAEIVAYRTYPGLR
jgi:hypothetical protein